MSNESTFREELERLEEIVRLLEGEEIDLDSAIKLFEEGVKRLRVARELLGRSERAVRKIVAEAGGGYREEDLDV